MDRWSEFSQQIDNAFGAKAPAAGQPGQGAGNVPYAPGLMSGRQPGATPDARALYAGMEQDRQRQMGGMPSSAAAPGQEGPAAGGGSSPQVSPMAQAQMLDYLMKMMMQRASSGQTSPISSTGTF